MRRLVITREPKGLRLNKSVLPEAIAALKAVPFAGPLLVILAADFLTSAKEHGAEGLTRKRPGGEVIGIFIPFDERTGMPCVVIDAANLTGNVDAILAAQSVHVFAHEGWHALLAEQEEDVAAILGRYRAGDNTEAYVTLHMAAECLLEYRVELSVARSDATVEAARASSIHAVLTALDDKLEAARLREPSSLRVGELGEHLHDLFTYLGQLAAEQVLSGSDIAARLQRHRCWSSLVGDYWDRLRASLAAATSARERMAETELDDVAARLSSLIHDWMANKLGYVTSVGELLSTKGGVRYTIETIARPEPEFTDSDYVEADEVDESRPDK
jgi:hypothetical protein